MNIRINKKENFYLILKVLFTILIYFVGIKLLINMPLTKETAPLLFIFIFYFSLVILFFLVKHIFFIGYVKGNGVRLSEKQFPDVYDIAKSISSSLRISTLPKIYLIQSGGVINALATRFMFKNYIVIYSEVFELAYKDKGVLKFILAHEFGHIYQKHLIERFWTLPSSIIPFLDNAYSRACEYTCDNIGKYFTDNDALNGILLLAAGSELYSKVQLDEYLLTFKQDNTFVTKFVQLFMSHPYLPKRISNIND